MAYNTRADQKGQFVLNTVGTGFSRVDGVAITSAPTGVTGGFTANTGLPVNSSSTFTGGTGSTVYTIDDIVAQLKGLGFLKA